ncbi:MAG: HEAT repeat domain-containing protein [Planctomycetota bacterium]|jgi:HEAT repeat protein
MDPSLEKVVALLEAEEREVRWAAAKILGALQPDGDKVVPALARALASEDQRLRATALDALAAIGGTEAYDQIAPLLEEPGDLGHRAVEVVAGMGSRVLGRLKRRFAGAGEIGRQRILTIAARLRGADGLDLIVRALDAGHADAVVRLAGPLADELSNATTRERNTLLRRLDKFLASAAAQREPESAGAAIDLMARIVGGQAQVRLRSYAAAGQPPPIRKRALEALADLAPGGRLESDLLTELLGFLNDPDFAHVVAPAMAVLERAKLNASHAGPLLELVHGSDPALRRFAVTALGQVDTARSAAVLLEILNGDNPDLQKRAALALAKQTAAVAPVALALAAARDARTAWVLARILHPHAYRLKPDQVTALAEATAAWLGPGDSRAEAVLSVLRDQHFETLAEANLKRVKRLRKARVPGEIVNLLRPLLRDELTTPAEVRYEIALAEIMRGRKDVVREVRLRNVGLQALERLLHEPEFTLMTRLKRDKAVLMPEEYYLIGCHFAERSYADRAFGGEMLRWLVQSFPDDTSAQAAAHKLMMEGFPPPPRPRKPAPKPAARKKAAPRKKAVPKKQASPKKEARTPKKAPAKRRTAASKKTAVKRQPAPRVSRKKTARKTNRASR